MKRGGLSPSQTTALSVLAIAAFLIIAHRDLFPLPASMTARPFPAITVEVTGDVPNPGVHLLANESPTIQDALAAAGSIEANHAESSFPPVEPDQPVEPVAAGDRLTVSREEDGTRRVEESTMEAPALLALGRKLDVNRASTADLRLVPRMREAFAEAIVERRGERPWSSLDELREIKGIGPKTVEKWRNFLYAEESETPFPETGQDEPTPVSSPKTPPTLDTPPVSTSSESPIPAATVHKSPAPVNVPPTPGGIGKIDINRASADQLKQIPGIGEVFAERIIRRRQSKPFGNIEELTEIKGIGPKRLAKWSQYLTVGATAEGRIEKEPATGSAGDRPAMPDPARDVSSHKLDVNHASFKELKTVPWMRDTFARAIIEHRAQTPWKNLDELQEIKGVGPKTVERWRPYLRVDGP